MAGGEYVICDVAFFFFALLSRGEHSTVWMRGLSRNINIENQLVSSLSFFTSIGVAQGFIPYKN